MPPALKATGRGQRDCQQERRVHDLTAAFASPHHADRQAMDVGLRGNIHLGVR